MKLALMGPLSIRVPGNTLPERCKRNADGSNFVVLGHFHKRPHVTVLWNRWRIIQEAPVRDAAGEVVGWQLVKDWEVSGTGPDSIVLIPAEYRHRFELLDPTGFYACNFGHYDPDGNPAETYQGDLTDYE